MDENVEAASLNDGEWTRTDGSSGSLTPPSSDLTQQAYDTIAKMDLFQEQLLWVVWLCQRRLEIKTDWMILAGLGLTIILKQDLDF